MFLPAILMAYNRGIEYILQHPICVAFFFVPQNLLTCLVTQRQNCWGEFSIILYTDSQCTKLKVVLFILPFWDRNPPIVILLLLSQTDLTIFPVTFLPVTSHIIPSCGSASLVETFCFYYSLTNRFPSTSHSIFIYDGRSSSLAGILLSWCPHKWFNSRDIGMDVYTLLIPLNMSAYFLFWHNIFTFLDDKNKAFS